MLTKYLLITAGWISVSLGIIGIVLPILPSTVFFIIAAWCFAKSSKKFYNWLIFHPVWGKQVQNFLIKRGMPLQAKIIAIGGLFFSIFISIYFFARHPLLIIFLIAVAIGVSGYIISLNTIRSTVNQED